MSLRKPARTLSLALTTTAANLAAMLDPAAAQTPGESGAPVMLERVEVTGSRVKRLDALTPSPVQVFTREAIERSGYTSISDLLRGAVSANNSGTLTQAFSIALAPGGSGIALRGMTLNATLVLIDGHRMAPYPIADDGQRSFVDLSSLPLAMVERIEILKDGASAIYGSDAIAGVVNIILKKQFKGMAFDGDFGVSQKGDGRSSHFSALYGFGDLEDEGHNAFFNLEYRRQSAILQSSRPALANMDFRSLGGPDLRSGVVQPGATIPNNGTPTLFGMVAPLDPATRQLLPNAGFQNLPGCAPENLNASGGCTYDKNVFRQIQPATQNINLSGRFTTRFDSDWTAGITASLFNSRAEQQNWAQYVPNSWGNYSTLGVADQTDPTTSGVVLPIGHPDNPFPNNPAFLNYAFGDVGPMHTGIESNIYRLVGDVKGGLGGWDLDASVGFIRGTTQRKYRNFISSSALNSVLADGSYRVGVNAGLNSRDLYARLSPNTSVDATSRLTYASLRGTREIGNLSGGPMEVAIGGEVRHLAVNDPGQPGTAAGDVVGVGTAFVHGSQSVQALYAELVAPVLKSVEIDAALRADHYNGTGSKVIPKLGFKYSPVEPLLFRGTYSQGFRAPGPAENGDGAVTAFTSLGTDAERCPTTGLPTDCGSGQGALLIASNGKLKPERSKSGTLGIVFKATPSTLLSLDWYLIRRTEEIVIAPFDLAEPIRGAVQSNYPNLPGPVLAFRLPYVNASHSQTSGVDFSVQSTTAISGVGELSADLSATHIIRYVQCFGDTCFQYAGTHGPTGVSGNTGMPADRANLQLALTRGPATVGTNVSYRSGMKNIDQGVDGSNCLNPWFTACRIGSFTTFDVFGSYRIDKRWTVRGSVLNVFNRSAPFDPQTYGGVNYNPAFDQAGAIGRYFRVGLNYSH